MNENFVSHDLNERLTRLAGFCSIFELEGFEFGKWCGGEEIEPGVIEDYYFKFGDGAAAFINMCYEAGWIVNGFNWSEWMRSIEAEGLRDMPEKLAEASPDQLAKLLTVLVRQDRFCEGNLAAAYQSGLILGILHRASVLVGDEPLSPR